MNDLTVYETIRGNIKSGDMLQYESESALGWLIRQYSRDKRFCWIIPYGSHPTPNPNHTAPLITDYEDKKFRVYCIEALEHGPELTHTSERLKNHKGHVWYYPLLDKYDYCRTDIKFWLMDVAALKVGYDYGSIFKQMAAAVSADAKKLFCSETEFLGCKEGGKIPELQGITIAPKPAYMPSLGIFGEPTQLF